MIFIIPGLYTFRIPHPLSLVRNKILVKQCLSDLKKAAQDEENLMPYILKAVKAYATLGEIIDSLKEIYGEYQEPITY